MSEGAADALIPFENIQGIQITNVSASSRVSRARLNHDLIVMCKTFALDAIPHTQFCAGAASCDHMACLLPAVAFWMSLRHRTITQCFGVTVSPLRPNEIMLVTECASNTFERWLEKTASVSFKDLIHVIKELLKCLVYLHKRDVPICHGALNPANILVFEAKATTILKLTNIGAAFPSSCKRGFLYNAPEDIPSIKADMYALGVLIADIAMIKLYDEAANLVPLATSWTDSRSEYFAAAVERISRVSLPVSSLVLECCLRNPGDRIDAASALFRIDMYTLPVPNRTVAMDEESTAVEKCYDLVRVMGPVRRTHVKAVLAVMRDYSASLRVLEAGCKALADVASATMENRDAVASTSAHITVISTMMLFRDIQIIQFVGLKALLAFVGFSGVEPPSLKQLCAIRQDGGIVVVMQALVQHMSSPLVAENATHVIAALARDAGCKRILLRYLALQRLTEAMALHVKLPLLHEYALAACVRICDGFAKGLNQFVAMDGAVPLYASMDAHKDILPVALQGCRMMELLTRPASGYITYFFDSAGIKRLYKAMDRFQSDEQIAAVFSQTMYNFTLKEDYRGPCVGTDGLSRLYAAIRTHLVSRNVLRPAIGALFNVATLPSNIDSVVRTFGMTRLIAVMEAHRYREDLTQACISCFVLLTGAEKHRLSVAQSNACELTIGGIQRHSTDAPLVEQACALLANLAQQQDCVPIMWSKGAAVQLLSAIINFPASEIIACMALRALLGLCSLPACVEYLMGQACAENVLKPLIAMVDCAALQVVGCDVMFRLCTTEEHIMAFFNAGAVTHAYDVMEKHDLLPTAQASAMGLLATMAVVPIVANRIVQTSGLKRVHRALTRHVVSRPALEAGVSALCAFATASDSNRRTMLESDCIDRVFMAMDRIKGSVLLQARACAFIFAMAGLREARSELRSRGAIDRIHRTRVSNPTSDEVITWAGRALQRLTACVVCSVQ